MPSNKKPGSRQNASQSQELEPEDASFERPDPKSQEIWSPTPVQPKEYKCRLWHLKRTIYIAMGTVYMSDGKQMLHNRALPRNCYKVSIDESLVDAACIPDVGNNGFKTVKDVVGTFVAWPKDQVVIDEKQTTPPNSMQKIDVNKTAPKVSKRKATYISRDVVQKQAANKKSQKNLNL